MPAAAFALVAFFVATAVVVGIAAWWLVGPRQPWTVVLPVVAAFAALYLVGHRLGISVGPTVRLFGFEVALLWDVAVAALAALGAAVAQRMLAQQVRRRRGQARG